MCEMVCGNLRRTPPISNRSQKESDGDFHQKRHLEFASWVYRLEKDGSYNIVGELLPWPREQAGDSLSVRSPTEL